MASNDTDAMRLPLKQRIVELENKLSQCKAEIARLQSNVRQDETPNARPRAGIHFDYQSLFANIAAVTTDAFIVVDADQRIRFFNSGAEKTFGYRAEEMIGQPLEVLLPERFAETHRIYFRGFAASPETSRMMGSRHEIRGRRRDGTLFPAEATISKVREGDDIVFVTVLRDITERKQAETEIRELTNDLERRVAERTAQLEVANAELQREIAERKQAEDALRHNEARFRALIENSYDAVALISTDATVLYESPAISRILGYSSEERLGRSGFDNIHLNDLPETRRIFAQLLQNPNATATAQFRARRNDGALRWLEATATNLVTEPSVQAVVVNYRDITERKHMEETLRESERRLRALFEGVQLVGVMLDAAGTITFANDYLARVAGWDRDELAGKNWFDCFLPPEIRNEVGAIFLEAIEKGNVPAHYENEIVARNGERRLIRWNNTVLRDPDDMIIGTASLGEDITDYKQMEQALRASEDLYRSVISSLTEGILVVNTDGLIRASNASAERILGLTAEQLREWKSADPRWGGIHEDGTPFPVETHPSTISLRTGQPCSNIVMGIYRPDKPLVWISINSQPLFHPGEPKPHAVVASFADITDRKRAERLLRVQHAVAQVLAETTTLKEATPRILQAVCQSLEWRLGELWLVDRQRDELRCSEIWHPPALALEGFEAASEAHTFKRGIGLVGQVWASGEAAWVADVTHDANFVRSASATHAGLQSAFGFPLRGKNGILGVMVFLCHEVQQPDLDLLRVAFALGAQIGQFVERKRAEDALRKSEASLVAAQRMAHLGNWDWNIETNELLWSDEIYRMFGLAPQQFGGTYEAFLNSVHPDDREYVIKSVDEALYGRKPYDIEHRIVLSTGEVRIVNEQAEVVVNDAGRPIRMIGTVQDVTEHKQAEAALRESEERFRRLAENAVDVIYRYHLAPTRGFDYISRAITTISGYTPEEYYSDPDLVVKLVHPDDRHLTEAFRQSDTSAKQLISRWVRKDGSMIWMEHRAVSLFDAAGNMIAVEGIGRDITARMQAEDELRKLSSAIEQTEDMVVITDANGITEYVNPAFEAQTGFAREFAIGKTPAIVKSGKHSQDFYTRLWLTILAGQTFRGEVINRKKNGELFYEEKTITPLRDGKGNITHFVSTGKDITERKRAQQRLERHTLQLEALTQMGQIALASLDLETVLKNAVDEILALMRCEHIYVLLSDNGDLVFAAVGGEGADALRGRHIPVYTGVAGQVMGNGHAVRMSSSMPHGNVFQEIAQASDQPVQTLLAAPLRLGSRLIGVVEAVHSDPDAFNEEDLRLLEAAASWASIAIHNAKQHETIRRRLQESEALASISRALNETVDLERILQMIVDAAQQIIPTVERTVIHLLDEKQHTLRPVAVAGMHEPGQADFSMRPGEGVAGHAIAEGTVINVRDTRNDPRYLPSGNGVHLRSLLVAPVQAGSRPLGTISVQSATVNAFSADDEHLLMMLGVNAAIAIENARLFQAEREQARRLTAIGQMAQQISKSLVLDELLHRAVDLVQRTFGYYYVDVLLVDLPAGEIVLRASASPSGRRLYEGYRLKIGQQGIAGWVASLGQPLLVNDVAREPRYHPAPELADTRSELAVPIPGPAGLIGVLDVQSIERDAFDEADLATLQAFAGHLAVALENAQLYSDLTHSLQQEQEMRAQLIQAAKLGALGRLTASLAHEINNPLQSVQGCLTLAREELESQQRRDKMERYLGIAGTEIERISTIVRNMREFYRPARADLQLTDLHAILRSVLELSSKQLQHSNITFKRTWADDLPKIEANPDHLKQVFLNLVLNAVDSMPEGGTLSISTSRDEIRPGHSHPAQPAVQVQFSDTGRGMPPEVMSRLFEPFVTTKEHGSGLGLSISYRIIQSHNGQFSVASQEGKGSTFSILLPLQQPAAGDEPPLGD